MKTNLLKFLIFKLLFFPLISFSQIPEKMTYQSVIRDEHGHLLSNKQIQVRIRILEGSEEGATVYEEYHDVRTNYNGLLTFEIGNGTQKNGNIGDINWGEGVFFIESAYQLKNESMFSHLQVHLITSVPYALHAKTAENVFSGNYHDLHNLPNIGDSIRDFVTQDEFSNLLENWQENKVDSLKKNLPSVETIPPSINGSEGFAAGGKINGNGNTPIYAMGVSWSNNPQPSIYDQKIEATFPTDSFVVQVKNVINGASYYVRAYATNPFGTTYGENHLIHLPVLFGSCSDTPILIDVDGNYYNTIQIGTQCWMRENLRTSRYADGASIKSIATPNYNYSDIDYYNSGEDKIYGFFYNWDAIMRGSFSSESVPSEVQGVCPEHWHVPSMGEWQQMAVYVQNNLNGASSTAVALANDRISWQGKGQSSTLYSPSNSYSTGYNSSGFSAFPTGYYNFFVGKYGSYCLNCYKGTDVFWATTTEGAFNTVTIGKINYSESDFVFSNYTQENGYAVRCVRD